MLDSLLLEHLLGHLAGNNLSLYFRDYVEQTMDGNKSSCYIMILINCHNISYILCIDRFDMWSTDAAVYVSA